MILDVNRFLQHLCNMVSEVNSTETTKRCKNLNGCILHSVLMGKIVTAHLNGCSYLWVDEGNYVFHFEEGIEMDRNFKTSHIWNIYGILNLHSILMHFFFEFIVLKPSCNMSKYFPCLTRFQRSTLSKGDKLPKIMWKRLIRDVWCSRVNCNILCYVVCCYKYDVFYMLNPSMVTWLANEYLV